MHNIISQSRSRSRSCSHTNIIRPAVAPLRVPATSVPPHGTAADPHGRAAKALLSSAHRHSPALPGHNTTASKLSVDLNSLQLSLPAIRSHHNSLSVRSKEPKSSYVSSVDICDDDLEDDKPLAELNESLSLHLVPPCRSRTPDAAYPLQRIHLRLVPLLPPLRCMTRFLRALPEVNILHLRVI